MIIALVTFQLIEKSRLHFDDTLPRAASRRAWGVELTPARADVRDDVIVAMCAAVLQYPSLLSVRGLVVQWWGKHDNRENCGMKPTARRSTERGLV
jgi:hypothetical protein